MVLTAPHSAKLVNTRGSRFTLLITYLFCLLGFLTMLLMWKEGIPYWKVSLGYAFIGVGVGFAGTPASHSLTGFVPIERAGMASGTAGLQRDLGGAIMQSILGALLTAGYAAAFGRAIANAPSAHKRLITDSVVHQLQKSFVGAADTAQNYPRYAGQITAAAKSAFLWGDQSAYSAGIVAILLGAVLVFFLLPKKDDQERLLTEYQSEDAWRMTPPGQPPTCCGTASPMPIFRGRRLEHYFLISRGHIRAHKCRERICPEKTSTIGLPRKLSMDQ